MKELQSQKPELSERTGPARGRPRIEQKNPQLAIDIRLIVKSHTQTAPEQKTSSQYTKLSAAEVLIAKGYREAQLPSGFWGDSRLSLFDHRRI